MYENKFSNTKIRVGRSLKRSKAAFEVEPEQEELT